MGEHIHQIVRWVEQRWRSTGPFGRAGYVALVLALVVAAVAVAQFVPGFEALKDFFARARPEVQVTFLIVLLAGGVAALVWGLQRSARVEQLKGENEKLAAELSAVRREAHQLQERWDHLLAVETKAGLWAQPAKVVPPPFIPMGNRTTRFLTVLNFKGGVGKTTLTANLAACLGLGTPPKRVLLIDIDFQGTLGLATVENVVRTLQEQNKGFVDLLLRDRDENDDLIRRLAVPMNRIAPAKVILASDTLDPAEYNAQARFFVDPTHEARYHFRDHLHRDSVFQAFDLVVFDCPPRVTTSVVNALACSDFVLIPTRLDRGSVEAVPRTIQWMKRLKEHCPAGILGVVASHAAVRTNKLVKADQESYDVLRALVRSACNEDVLFRTCVPSSPRAAGTDHGQVAGLTAEGREVFAPFVAELRSRIQI